jgi:chloride channel protein, CIC family
LAAVASQGFMRLLSSGERAFGRLPMPYRAAFGGLLAGCIIVVLPAVAGNGFEPLNALLDAQLTVGFVAVLLVGKVLATTASVSSGSPGGVFTPSLLLGGAVGILYAEALGRGLGLPLGSAGGYALVGMAAAVSATTHAPLMAAILVFELSGDYAIVLPLILATAVAVAVSRKMRTDSIYMAELKNRGVSWKMTLEGRKVRE